METAGPDRTTPEREKEVIDTIRQCFKELNVANQRGETQLVDSSDLIDLRRVIERLERKTS